MSAVGAGSSCNPRAGESAPKSDASSDATGGQKRSSLASVLSGADTAAAAALAEFESSFIERARKQLELRWKLDSVRFIVPASGVSVDAGDGEALLLGWWCVPPQGTAQPVLPNPWDDPDAVSLFRDWAWRQTRALIDELAPRLNKLHGTDWPVIYWDAILSVWLNDAVSVVLDRRLLCLTAAALAPSASFLVVECPESPLDTHEALDRHVSDEGNLGLFSLVIAELKLPFEFGHRVLAPEEPVAALRIARIVRILRHPPTLARTLTLNALPILFGGHRGRRLLAVNLPLGFGDAVWLRRRVAGLRFGSRRGPGKLGGAPDAVMSRERLRLPPAGRKGAASTLAALLPDLLPRSVVEDYGEVATRSRRRWGEPCAVVNGNLSSEETTNEFLGRCLAGGRPVALAQHGGGYRTYAVNAWEQLEIRPEFTFASWGWRGEGAVPLPSPHLSRLRDSYRGGDAIVLIEILLPRYLQRFTSYPIGSQTAALGDLLLRFVEAVGRDDVRARLALKRSIAQGIYRAPRHPGLERLPHERFRSPRAADWMRNARLVVVTYPDTTFIEAMAIGAPTIGLWDPRLWRLSDEAQPYFEALESAGAIFTDPLAAAAQLDEIYDSARAWWQTPTLQQARLEFVARFGLSTEWPQAWVDFLQRIST